MRNWKAVEIPQKMQHLPKDKRGYPVPHIILMSKDGEPNFIVNNDVEVWRCLSEKRCHVCGLKLEDDMWMLGGPKSAFHPRGAFNDGPVHKECGEYALQVCPYLAVSNYKGKQTMDDIAAGKFDSPVTLYNPTQDPNRVPFFVFAKVSDYNVSVNGINRYVKPVTPYLEVEYWNDGVRLNEKDVKLVVDSIKNSDTEKILKMFVLYKQPSDYPDEYVVREAHVTGSGPVFKELYMRDKSLGVITEKMGKTGMRWIPRHENDDPVILGTWL